MSSVAKSTSAAARSIIYLGMDVHKESITVAVLTTAPIAERCHDSATGTLIPLSRPTDGGRVTADLLMTFFSGALSVCITHPIDRAGAWKFTGRIGQEF